MTVRVVIRGSTVRLRSASSFGMSAAFHAFLLEWLVLAAANHGMERPLNIYQQEIQPFEKHLVWYNLRERLPDVGPAEAGGPQKAARARVRFKQNIVAGKKDDSRPSQKILMDAPAIELPKALPLPNALAVTTPRPLRPFVQPPEPRRPIAPAPALPNPPAITRPGGLAPNHVAMTAPRLVRQFVPPPQNRPAPATAPVLPDPSLNASLRPAAIDMATPAARAVRAFTPLSHPAAAPAKPVTLADAPSVAPLTAGSVVSLEGTSAAPRRPFVEPEAPRKQLPPAEPGAPPVPAPPVASPEAISTPATLAIAGLNAVNTPDIPRPPGSHDAGFSAGVQPNPQGDNAASDKAWVTVPDLLVSGGGKDTEPVRAGAAPSAAARKNLLAVLDSSVAAALARTRGEARAARLPTAPDPRMRGRYIYTLAIQMPNVTSYSGSWTVWFADHDPSSGAAPAEIRPPVAVRKVDPKYIPAAVEERVEGTVRLAAVIRKTGHVDSVELLQHLDERLDRSAQEALAKWEFEPAQLNGAPIDIDAVFEIPFRLAPRPKR